MSHHKAEYPKYLYHKNEQPKLVHSADEHKELGKGWEEEPHAPIKGERGDALPYATGEVAEAQVPEQDNHATEKTGADSKFGAEQVHGVKKVGK